MTSQFNGSTVLITGAGSGIGRATAQAFAAEGAQVVVSGRREAPLKETVRLIESARGTASLITADATSDSDVAETLSAIVKRHGRLDIAVNNAGVANGGPITDFDPQTWETMWRTNVTGIALALKHQIRQMREQGGGTIVNIASSVGHHKAVPQMPLYGATKAAVTALSRAAAKAHIAEGVRVNVVSPGASETSMSLRPGEDEAARAERMRHDVPLGRLGSRDEVASAVLWLAGPGSGFAVGSDVVVDGGVSL